MIEIEFIPKNYEEYLDTLKNIKLITKKVHES